MVEKISLNTLLELIETAFQGDPSHSLLGSLRRLKNEDYTSLPPGGGRSIASILEHVGWCKWMYEDYAFGSASLKGDRPPLTPPQGQDARPLQELLHWLKEGHKKWASSVKELKCDDELNRKRLTNWGEYLPTRRIIQIMIAHGLKLN